MYNTEKEIRDELNSISKCLQLVCGKEDEILRTFSGAIPALYLLQNVALYKALKRGVDPDRPNGLSAWIRL